MIRSFLFLIFTLVVFAEVRTIYAPQAYERTENQKLQEVADLLSAQPTDANQRKGLAHLLHTALHQNIPPSYHESGVMVNELHPPVKVVIQRRTKARKVPHRDAEVSRRLPTGSVVVALGTTSDMLWLQVGKDEFIPTRDAHLEEPLNREQPKITMLSPPLDVHVRSEVTVRKIPDIGGKPVAMLHPGATLTAVGVTPDYSWLMIAPNQYIPTMSTKLGDPTTPLRPPVTIHLRRTTIVRDAPTMQGKPVTTLNKGDIMQAIAVSSDLLWLKISHNNFIRLADAKLGLPLPPTMTFPRPLMVKVIASAPVVKNPHHPDAIIRHLRVGDELEVFGATTDFKWLIVAQKRFIPMETVRMKEALPQPHPLSPPVPIKISREVEVRDIPDERGHVLLIARKGDKYEAFGVSADFTWLQIGPTMWIPLQSAFFRKPTPITNPLVPPMKIYFSRDTKVRKTPDNYGKIVRVIAEGETVTAIAATPDLLWAKLGEKEYVRTQDSLVDDSVMTVPLFPFITVVVTKDVKVLKAPKNDALPVHQLKRGEKLEIHETTDDLKWLKLSENQYIPTEYTAHVPHSSSLTPPVRIVIAADVKVRNVPAFAGMGVKDIKKGEIVDAVEVTPDFKWLKLAKDQYIPASACVLHESEGKDMLVVLKIRNTHKDKENTQKDKGTQTEPNKQLTTSQAASMLQQAFEKKITTLQTQMPTTTSTAKEEEKVKELLKENKAKPIPTIDLSKSIDQLRIKTDTIVMSEPNTSSVPVRGIRKGTLVDAKGLGTNLVWLKIAPNEYVKIEDTEPTDNTAK